MSAVAHPTAATPTWMIWTGRVLSALPALMMLFSASMKLSHSPKFIESWVGTFAYPEAAATPIGIVEVICAVLLLVPRTRVLGAILVTGYMGGAIATHVRIGQMFILPLLFGVFAWGGLFLRDERVRALIPLTKSE